MLCCPCFRYHKLTNALGKVLDDFSLVRYVPLNINKEESLTDVLIQTDFALQYGEDFDVKGKDFELPDPEDREWMLKMSSLCSTSAAGGKID